MTYYTEQAARTHIETHARHIASGLCPSVNWTKAWCNRTAAHSGEHLAPYVAPTGVKPPAPAAWTDADAAGCPCTDAALTEGGAG